MGYTTEFEGTFELDKPLTIELATYLEKFADSRRMKRKSTALQTIDPTVKFGFDGSHGSNGEYYIGGEDSTSIIDYNNPPSTQPSLWCQWIPTDDGTGIEWDGNEKFYYAKEWLIYLIDHFLKPSGYVLNGTVNAQGEEHGDSWSIIVTNNVVS